MGFIELEAIGEGERKSEVVKKKRLYFFSWLSLHLLYIYVFFHVP